MGGPGIGKSAMRVIVVGAGIGGLTTGIALAQAGIGVELLEQTARLGAVGAGVTLAPTTVPRYGSTLKRPTLHLLKAIKAAVDPGNMTNPGCLDLP